MLSKTNYIWAATWLRKGKSALTSDDLTEEHLLTQLEDKDNSQNTAQQSTAI